MTNLKVYDPQSKTYSEWLGVFYKRKFLDYTSKIIKDIMKLDKYVITQGSFGEKFTNNYLSPSKCGLK